MRYWFLLGLAMSLGAIALAEDSAKTGNDKKADKAASPLQQQIAKADIVVVGKVSQVGLSAASSFDVGVIEVRQVLKGKGKPKSVKFRFASSGGGRSAPYGKKGVDGVWILGKEGAYLAAREVLSYQSLRELKTIEKIIAKKR